VLHINIANKNDDDEAESVLSEEYAEDSDVDGVDKAPTSEIDKKEEEQKLDKRDKMQ
jgi:hypothetical protein